MIRLVLLLGGGLYVALLILGADHGQKRHGLMLADAQPKAQVVAQVDPPKTVFVPAQPVRQAAVPVPPVETAQPGLQTVSLDTTQAQPAPSLPTPEVLGGQLFTVTAVQANVRGGPGRSFAVLDSLSRGEQVLVIPEDQPLAGWSRIRIEGDGIEGYVSTKLLTRSD